MSPIEEECIRRLSTLNETAPSIEGSSYQYVLIIRNV